MRNLPFQRERIFWMIFTIILLLPHLFIIGKLRKESAEAVLQIRLASQRERRLKEDMGRLNATVHSLKAQRKYELEVQERKLGLISKYELASLRGKGLPNPIADLRADLQKHRELIAHFETPGWKMRFSDESIHLLGYGWAYADFSDGHAWGRALLKYQVSDKGKISWKVLYAEIPQ
jgi:hypothetical protein